MTRTLIAREDLVVVSGSAHPELAAEVARELGRVLTRPRLERFPDGEVHVEVCDEIRGCDVVIVQPTGWPGGENILELLMLADACWRARARTLTAVVPYFGYARQDHRSGPGEALGARVVVELLGLGHFELIIAVDLHSAAIEGFFDTRLLHVSAVPHLADALRPHAGRNSVVVSPDLGAAKLARQVARLLELPMAVVHKTRTGPSDVVAERVIGDVAGHKPILVDDMITTGATIAAAARAVVQAGAAAEIIVAATHAVLASAAVPRLREAGVKRLIVTDSVPPAADLPFPREIVRLAPLLANAILQPT